MQNKKRQIRGQQFSISETVHEAMESVDGQKLNLESARTNLAKLGHSSPADELVTKYARNAAILAILERKTGAYFTNQIGKIDFTDEQSAISAVNAYLNRRNAGHRSRWGK